MTSTGHPSQHQRSKSLGVPTDGLHKGVSAMCDNGNFFDNWDWQDIAMAGFLAEEMADEELERILAEREHEPDDEEQDL